MTIVTQPGRFVLSGPSGAPSLDTNKRIFTITDIVPGTLNFPDYFTEYGGPTIINENINIGAVNGAANCVLGGLTISHMVASFARQIMGTINLWGAWYAMNNDGLALSYLTRALGPSVPAISHDITFFVSAGALWCNHIVFVPQSGTGSRPRVIPATTINFQALVGVI